MSSWITSTGFLSAQIALFIHICLPLTGAFHEERVGLFSQCSNFSYDLSKVLPKVHFYPMDLHSMDIYEHKTHANVFCLCQICISCTRGHILSQKLEP